MDAVEVAASVLAGVEVPWERSGIVRAVLQYKGELLPKSRCDNMHWIRRELHPQMKRLWAVDETLKQLSEEVRVLDKKGQFLGTVRQIDRMWEARPSIGDPWDLAHSKQQAIGYIVDSRVHRADPGTISTGMLNDAVEKPGVEDIVERFTVGQFGFLPLVTRELDLMCHLDITILRRDGPGLFVKNGGDLDNRIKSLIDALRVPDKGQVSGMAPQADESPFYCLLEDDALISGISIKTEQWLAPDSQLRKESEVHVNVVAVVRPTRVTQRNLSFLSGWL